MATQAPTFGLDGSELDVMDGLFFNELTDLPVEPAHNQTLFAQPKSEPPITDEELIASLPLPHEAPAGVWGVCVDGEPVKQPAVAVMASSS